MTGTVVQPSDQRIKEDISAVDSSAQLDNIKNLRLYTYRLKDDWAETANRSDDARVFCAAVRC